MAQTNLQLYEQVAAFSDADRLRVRDAYDLATELFSGRYRGNGKPFVAHLVGTASVLARHGAALEVVLAGLLHAAYQQGEFGSGRFGMTPRRRQRVRSVIGADAEALVARYTTYDWSRVPDNIDATDVPVVTMRIANELDECLDRGLLYAGAGKRQAVEDGVARFVSAARALHLSTLADELDAAASSNLGSLPDGLPASRNGSFTIAPPLLATARARLRAVTRPLRR